MRGIPSLLILVATGLLAPAAQAQVAEFNATNSAARAARESGDHPAYLASVRKLLALTPGHPSLQVHLARALALNGDGAGAVAQLNRVADAGISFPSSAEPAFEGLKDDPGFIAAAQRIAANGKGSGRRTATIELGLTSGSEGVAWSESMKSFLMGSAGLIHAYRLGGTTPARPVARALRPQILGIRPDPASRTWLTCVNAPDGSYSAVVRHHEGNGAITAVYRLPTENALCNDIALLPNGSFAVTDTNNGAVFRLVGDKLEPIALTEHVYFANGIAADREKNRLYVAHAGGIVAHDLATGRSRNLNAGKALIGGLDGMVLHRGSLIAVQNIGTAGVDSRLLRITPDAQGSAVEVEVLLGGADIPGQPTTVAVAGNEAFVIARKPAADGQPVKPFLIRAPL